MIFTNWPFDGIPSKSSLLPLFLSSLCRESVSGSWPEAGKNPPHWWDRRRACRWGHLKFSEVGSYHTVSRDGKDGKTEILLDFQIQKTPHVNHINQFWVTHPTKQVSLRSLIYYLQMALETSGCESRCWTTQPHWETDSFNNYISIYHQANIPPLRSVNHLGKWNNKIAIGL